MNGWRRVHGIPSYVPSSCTTATQLDSWLHLTCSILLLSQLTALSLVINYGLFSNQLQLSVIELQLLTIEQLCGQDIIDFVCIFSKFMNFQVIQMYGNDGTFQEDSKLYKQQSLSSLVTLTGKQYCKRPKPMQRLLAKLQCNTAKLAIRPSLVHCLFPIPMHSKNRGGREVIIDYLLCQCAKAKCVYMR